MARKARENSEPPALAGYRVERWLGGGGFASVWSAVARGDGQRVALKVSQVATSRAVQRFAREARALERVGPPHVPRLFDRGALDDGRPYLSMELLSGKTMARWLGDRSDPVGARELVRVAGATLRSLQAVHDAGLLHGDLKPDNIFITEKPELAVKLLDFGIVRATTENSWREREREETVEEILGSAEYMAPEQLLGARDPSVDIYASGVLLYEMLTLRVPFVGDAASIKRGHQALRPARPSSFAEVPEALEALCLRCLAKEPGKRPESVAALRALLDDAGQRSARSPESGTSRPSGVNSSVLVDARQPVVLLALEIDTGTRAVVHVIERHKGIVARQIGRRYVCGFSALDDAEPIRSALDTSRELVQTYGARIVLHIAQLKVRRRRRGQAARFFGPALQDVRSWKPAEDWRGILITRKLASAMPEDATQPSLEHPDFFEMAPTSVHVRAEPTLLRVPVHAGFIGRDELLTSARRSLRSVLDSGAPGLFSVIGDSGLGKSRLAHELVSLARETARDALVLSVRAARQLIGQSNETLHSLLELLAEHNRLVLPKNLARGQKIDPIAGAGLLRQGLRADAERPLVLIIDDLHFAERATLDALESALLEGGPASLWVAAISHPRLEQRRPQWGQRVPNRVALELAPLSEAASMRLAAELLHPAEYPPAATLQRLARWTGGSPHALVELVRTLKREGVVRKRLHSDSWYVATAAIDRLPASPAGQWLAARRLDALPMELSACVRMCAVLGVEFLRDELEWVQHAADRSGAAGSSIDTDVGLSELRRLGFFDERAGVWSFRQAALQDAVYNLVGTRERKRIHGDALEFWRGQTEGATPDRILSAIARHAESSEQPAEAADACLELGDRDRRAHRDVEADQEYTRAIRLLAEGDHERRLRGLGGRGRVRYRIQRAPEAIDDLQMAQVHASALQDARARARLLLEEATAWDWQWQYQQSAACVERARPLVEHLDDPRLQAEFLCAHGRCLVRQEQAQEAIASLRQSVELAKAHGDDEVLTLALIVLGAALTWTSAHAEALARYQELIELCQRTGDRLHLCAAHANKGLVWTEDSHERITGDLSRAIELARQLGQPTLERAAAHNLAEYLHRSGEPRQALLVARRSHELQRFLPEQAQLHIDALLLARIHAALEEFDEVARIVSDIRSSTVSSQLPPSEAITLAALELVLAAEKQQDRAEDWDGVIERARTESAGEEFLDVLYLRLCTARRHGRPGELTRTLERAQERLAELPVWRVLFERADRSAG